MTEKEIGKRLNGIGRYLEAIEMKDRETIESVALQTIRRITVALMMLQRRDDDGERMDQ